METKRIAVACFIGGVLCSAVALFFAPTFWWLGTPAGLAGGYFGYEFREVCQAVPVALRKAGEGISGEVTWAWDGIVSFIVRPHPFGYLSIVLYVIGLSVSYPHMDIGFVRSTLDVFHKDPSGSTAVCLLMWFSITVIFAGIAMAGMGKYGVAFWATEQDDVRMLSDGRKIVLLTYSSAFLWMGRGIIEIILFFVWQLWKYIAIGIWKTMMFLFRFAWHLFKLIHSHKRVLCAIDGMLGGAISYLCFRSSAHMFADYAALVLFGGLLGAAFGVADWKIVSKKILRVAS